MTPDEANRVAQAMQGLNQFATTSNMLNTNANWHATWQQVFKQAIQQIAEMVDKPTVNTEAPTPPIAPAEAAEEPDKKADKIPPDLQPVRVKPASNATVGPDKNPLKRRHRKRSRK